MRAFAVASVVCFVCLCLIGPVNGVIRVEGLIGQDVQVVYAIKYINSTLYEEILDQRVFNSSTIPQAIETFFEEHDLESVGLNYDPLQEIFNNFTKSIQVEFSLSGSGILGSDHGPAKITYSVETGWRKIHVNLTQNVLLNFTEYFGKPLSEWQLINYTIDGEMRPTYVYNYTEPTAFDPLCRFVLPAEAAAIHSVRDTIFFELPIPLEDNLINSPFLILGVLVAADIVLIAYRKIRR